MRKHKMTDLEKRHIRDLERKHQEAIAQIHGSYRNELMAAELRGFDRGLSQGKTDGIAAASVKSKEAETAAYAAGVNQGGADMLDGVLRHAGRLFQERKDNEANAVREVHRLLVEAAKSAP